MFALEHAGPAGIRKILALWFRVQRSGCRVAERRVQRSGSRVLQGLMMNTYRNTEPCKQTQ